MYTKNDKYIDTNGYVLVYIPDHPKAIKGGSFEGYVYEHVLVGEEILDRPIKEGEIVHHLDLNRSNNSPDNLLILSNPMHGKLHAWMDKHEIIPNEKHADRIKLGCVRCKFCEKPIEPDFVYCSEECRRTGSITRIQPFNGTERDSVKPTKEELEKLVWSKPTTLIAKEFGISDTAINRWCIKLGVEKPPRGYWTGKK
jgi:hypothetical protein